MKKEELLRVLEELPDDGEINIRFDYVGSDNLARLETGKPEILYEDNKIVLYVVE